jgi:hypothetical protein
MSRWAVTSAGPLSPTLRGTPARWICIPDVSRSRGNEYIAIDTRPRQPVRRGGFQPAQPVMHPISVTPVDIYACIDGYGDGAARAH